MADIGTTTTTKGQRAVVSDSVHYDQKVPWVLTMVANGLAVSAATVGVTAAFVAHSDYGFGASRWLTGIGWALLLVAAAIIVAARSWVQNENWLPRSLHHDASGWFLDRLRKPSKGDARQRARDALLASTIAGLMAAVGTTLALDHRLTTFGLALVAAVLMVGVAPLLTWLTVSVLRAPTPSSPRHVLQKLALPGYLLLTGLWLSGRAFVLEFDTALAAMTPSGRDQRGFTSTSSVFRPWAAPDQLQTTWSTWTDYEADNPTAFVGGGAAHVPKPIEAVTWHAIIDSLATVALALMLLGAISWLTRRVADLPGERAGKLKAMLSVARFAAPTIAVLDIAENALGVGAVRLATVGETANELGTTAKVLTLVRGFATTGKVVTFAALGAAILIAAGHLVWAKSSKGPVGTSLRTLRAHIALVAVFTLALRNGQVYDAIRNWQTGPGDFALDWPQIAWTAVLALAAFAAVRFLGDFVLQQTLRKAPEPEGDGNSNSKGAGDAHQPGAAGAGQQMEHQARWGYGVGVLALASVLGFLLNARGLFIGAAIYFLLEILSGPLRPRDASDAGSLHRLTKALFGSGKASSPRGRSSLIARLNPFWKIAAPALAFMVAAFILHATAGRPAVRWLLIAAAAATAGQGLYSMFSDSESIDATQRANELSHTVSRVLGTTLFIVLGAQVVRSGAGPVIYRSGGAGLVFVGLGFILIGVGLFAPGFFRFRYWKLKRALAAIRLAFATIFGAYLLVWELAEPDQLIRGAQRVGTIGLVLAFIALLAVIVSIVSYLAEQTGVLPALTILGFKRIPFYLLLGVWIMVAGRMDAGGYHDIDRLAPDRASLTELASGEQPTPYGDATADRSTSPARVDATAQRVFNDWTQRCVDGVDSAEGQAVVPMVFVAASGGGIRAAYWSGGVMDSIAESLEDAGLCEQTVFAMSGASGGSVGLAAHAVAGLPGGMNDATPTGEIGGTRDRLDDDYLAPAVGWFLFSDVVRTLFLWDLGGDRTIDRAGALARSFELSWDPTSAPPPPSFDRPGCDPDHVISGHGSVEIGVRDVWCAGAPLLLLNGTEVHSGCRFIGSVLDNGSRDTTDGPGPVTCRRPPVVADDTPRASSPPSVLTGPLGATIDAVDYLCDDEDLPLSVAAVLSARFPFVTPSGRIERCADDGSDKDVAFVVDGGYLDNSGASALIEMWAEISRYVDDVNTDPSTPCVLPVFVQIDNGYDFANLSSAGRPLEALVPLIAASSSFGSGEAEAKQVAANIFGSPLIPGDLIATVDGDPVRTRWIRIVPESHPGIQAPLGWVLSGSSRSDLDEQLLIEGRSGGLAQLERLLTADLSCDAFEFSNGGSGMDQADGQRADAMVDDGNDAGDPSGG